MRVLACGGRNWHDPREEFLGLFRALKPSVVIHGGARGADSAAKVAAWRLKIPSKEYPADWETHGRAAGPIRNQQMLTDGKPDLVVAGIGGRGTADMVSRARQAGVPVVFIGESGDLGVVREQTPPRYDDVYFEGLKWIEENG